MTASATSKVTSDNVNGRRWGLVAAAVLLQLALGAVYAWSVFSKALQATGNDFHLTKSEAALPFSVSIGMIFIGTFVGGRIQDAKGPRAVAMGGGIIYAIGILLAGLATSHGQLWLLVLGYGVIAGFGLGCGYIVPIAMLQKWFPDHRGLITGIAVGGFGFGAVLTSPVAQALIGHYAKVPTRAFLWLGAAYLVMVIVGASFFRNPPAGYGVPGWTAPAHSAVVTTGRDFSLTEALRTPQWYLLTAILTLNVTAGIALISVAAAAASDIAGYSAAAAATLVGVMGLFNGGGRVFWGWVSTHIGRMTAFLCMLGVQALCFLLLPHISTAALFAVLTALVYLCYGGGFGTMPATAGDFYGLRNAGAVYGLMIVGWSIGGVVGPLLVAALIHGKSYTLAFTTIGIIAAVALVLPIVTKPRNEAPATAKISEKASPATP
ncbi:MAG TPA: OFA family MFS transporter [Pseudonocardiaceae bacterium]|nr:OFA family MFS transporter [Pseudonocardiaceae bacterium]